eukprot:3740625-Rhodomonas_salina.1
MRMLSPWNAHCAVHGMRILGPWNAHAQYLECVFAVLRPAAVEVPEREDRDEVLGVPGPPVKAKGERNRFCWAYSQAPELSLLGV